MWKNGKGLIQMEPVLPRAGLQLGLEGTGFAILIRIKLRFMKEIVLVLPSWDEYLLSHFQYTETVIFFSLLFQRDCITTNLASCSVHIINMTLELMFFSFNLSPMHSYMDILHPSLLHVLSHDLTSSWRQYSSNDTPSSCSVGKQRSSRTDTSTTLLSTFFLPNSTTNMYGRTHFENTNYHYGYTWDWILQLSLFFEI